MVLCVDIFCISPISYFVYLEEEILFNIVTKMEKHIRHDRL